MGGLRRKGHGVVSAQLQLTFSALASPYHILWQSRKLLELFAKHLLHQLEIQPLHHDSKCLYIIMYNSELCMQPANIYIFNEWKQMPHSYLWQPFYVHMQEAFSHPVTRTCNVSVLICFSHHGNRVAGVKTVSLSLFQFAEKTVSPNNSRMFKLVV